MPHSSLNQNDAVCKKSLFVKDAASLLYSTRHRSGSRYKDESKPDIEYGDTRDSQNRKAKR